MSLEAVLLPISLVLAASGIYLNVCFLRATHRSTVYQRFLCRNLRFLSLMQLCLAFSNIVFTAAMWGSRASRTKKSEAFFSLSLSMTRAIPAATILWVTVERTLYNRISSVRDAAQFRYLALIRLGTFLGAIFMESAIRAYFESTDYYDNLYSNSTEPEVDGEDIYIKNSMIANFYVDYLHGAMFIACSLLASLVFYMARRSLTRAQLLGGMRNDQKIQNLRQQMLFFKRSYIPLFLGCLADFSVLLLIKRGLGLDDPSTDIVYVTARSLLPIIYPLSLISFHTNLRVDFIANIFICRKARNLHKESKVKVIATRESQESIIANLKMIGILSDVDAVQPGAMLAGMGIGMEPTRGGPIAKDPSSTTSVTSTMARMSSASSGGGGGTMMFHTRPKASVPSMGSVG